MQLGSRDTGWGTLVAAGVALLCVGCASPGPPRAPSLRLPELASGLSAERVAGEVRLTFRVSARTTDKMLVREKRLGLRVCREVEHSACETVPLKETTVPVGTSTIVEVLPTALATGPARLMAYRVELLNDKGKSAGLSESVYALAGTAPAAVENISARGSRLGILLTWSPRQGDRSVVVVAREEVSSHKVVRLHANDLDQARTLDMSAAEGVAYKYVAHREREVSLGGRTLLMRGPESAAVEFTLRDVYPPPVPTDVTAVGFEENGAFAVDLIWQPVEDPGLAGYNVYRNGVKVNTALVTEPGFHDVGAVAGKTYKYGVTAVDAKGNESAAGMVELAATTP